MPAPPTWPTPARPVLPAHAVREPDRDLPRAEASHQAAAAYARRLERFVLDYPSQWLGWKHLPD